MTIICVYQNGGTPNIVHNLVAEKKHPLNSLEIVAWYFLKRCHPAKKIILGRSSGRWELITGNLLLINKRSQYEFTGFR
jgi:hypothetical protein